MSQTSNKLGGLPWIAAIAFFMQSLDATILNTALPAIAASLHRSPLAMQSAIISYLLTVAMLIPTSGWCADRFGTQRVFVFAVALFSVGSLFCALSSSLATLVCSRILQGVGGAMMMPVARLTLLRAYPRDELLPVLNFVTMPGLIGPIVGPIVGGWLVTYASWHWIFLINIPIGLLGILFSYRYMPNFTTITRHFDGKGFLLFGIGLVCLSLSLELFSEPVLNAHYPLLFLALGVALLSCYIAHARSYPKALIRLSLFKTRTFSIGIVGNIAARLGTGCIPFLLPLMLQVGFGYSALAAGYLLAPIAVGSLLAKSFVTRVLRRFGYRHTLMTLTALISLFLALFALQNVNTPIWLTLLPLFLLGIITSLQFTAMNTITLADLDNDNTSEGNSVLAVTQQLAVSFGISVSAAILQFYNHHQIGVNTVAHFHYTFITIGILTLSASAIFMQLQPQDGNNLIAKRVNTRKS